ncbi:MAG: autotransporter-associated beta strand repeat-containing protein [Lewinellaceae bacterium]|nr:autotransporter-associated beta strand repeat-containing protein [Lewinellaceae bacterium]
MIALKYTRIKSILFAIIPIIALLLMASNAQGQKTWTGAASTDWNTAANWSPSGVPSNTSVLIPGGLSNYPVITSTVPNVTTISINNSGTGATLTVNTGGALTATGLITVNATGTFIMLNGTAKLTGMTSPGTVNVQGGTITSTVNLIISGTLTQSGGTIWLATNTATNPTDNLVITNGTVTQSGGLLATKNFAPTTGTFNQTGASAVFRIYRNWRARNGHNFNSTAGTVQFSGNSTNATFISTITQFNHILVDAGINPRFSQVVNSRVKISGNFTNNNTALNNTTNTTFTFNGTGNQTISSASTGTNATFGHVVINNTGGTVSLGSNITAMATGANLTLQAGSVLDLGGFNFGPNRGPATLFMEIGTAGSSISGTTGILTLAGNLTVNATSGSSGANISANIALGAASIFTVANDGTNATDLTVSGVISGSFALTKDGAGTIVLGGANSYTGATTVNAGTLKLGANGTATNTPLGTTAAGTTIAAGAMFDLNGFTLGTAEALTLNGTGISNSGVLTNTGGNATYSGAITLASDCTIAATPSGTLNLSGNISGNFILSLGNDGSGTFSGVMSGSGAVTKFGTGTWTFSGANSYSGATTITAGTLRYGANNALGSGTVTVNGGTLDIASFSDAVGAVTLISGAISGTTGILTGTSYDVRSGTVSAILAGAVPLTKNSTGNVTLSGVNTYTGVTTINAGVLSVSTIGNGGVAGNLGAATTTATNLVLSGGTLQYTGATASTNRNYVLTAGTTSTIEVAANTLTISGASTNTTGALVKTGAGTLVFSGTNLYTGLTSINEGTLTLGAANVIASGPVALNGGTFRTGATTGNSETVGTLNVGGGSTLALGTGVHTLNFAASNGISWAGSAILTIAGWAGAYNGTSGTAGKIFVGTSATGLTATQLAQIRFFNGSDYFKAIQLSTGEVVSTGIPFILTAPPSSLSYPTPNDFSKNAAITPLSPTVTGYVESYSVSPALPAGLSIDVLSGVISGTPTVLSSPTNYTVTATNSLGSTMFTLSIAINGKLASVGSGLWSSTVPNAPWPNGTVPTSIDDVTIGAGHTVTVDIPTATCKSITLGNGIGTATLDFLTTGSPMLTVVEAVVVGGSGATNRLGNITFASGSTLVAASVNLGGNATTPAPGTINMTNGGTIITGELKVNTVAGNTWTPGTGTVRMTTTNTLPATIFTSFANLQIDAATTTTGVAISATSLTVKAGAIFSLAHTATPASVVLEGGAAQGASISGAGTLSLGGNVTVNSVATGSNGASISAPISLGANRTFTVADDGTLATDLTISGIISGAFNLTKAGLGTMLLSGLNTYSGKTTISAGILAANSLQNVSGGASALGAPTTVANGTIDISGTGIFQYRGTGHSSNRVINLTASGGTIDAAGSGTLTLSGGVTGTNLSLVLTGVGTGIQSGTIGTGNGSLTMDGDGQWTLSGNNTYTGATTINNGTLALGASERISNSSALVIYGTFDLAGFSETVASLTGDGTVTSSVAAASTFTAGNNSNTTFDGIIEDGDGISVSLVKIGNGTLTLAGDNTYSGPTLINAGTIKIDLADGSIPDLSAVVVTGTLDLFGNDETIGSLAGAGTVRSSVAGAVMLAAGGDDSNTTFSGVIQNGSGTMSLTKEGVGALTLSGSNTYTGTTTISAGTLVLGAAERIANTSNVILSGGTFKTGATTGLTETVGTLTLDATSTIALGTGSHTLSFAASNGQSWSPCDTLIITGWQGGYNGTAGTAGKIKVGTTASGLTANQLVQIYFFNGSSYFAATILSTGEIVPLASAPIGPTPFIATTTPGSSCGTGTVTLGATASYGTVSWYATDSGGTALGTGTGFTTPSISSSTTYYAEAASNGCIAASRTAVTATVIPPLSVSLTIATPENPACLDSIAFFTATPTNGGTTPAYQWKVNGMNVGTNSTAFSYVPTNGDAVTCVLTSSETCTSGNPATSNTLNMMISPCINKWKGSISNNWNTPGNWTRNYVPATDANIIFDDNPVNHCQLDQNRSATNITNAQSTYRLICNGHQLTVKGNLYFTNGAQIDATSTNAAVKYAGASLQTIDTTQYLDATIYDLTIDNTTGVSLNTSFTVSNNLTINSGKLFTIEPRKTLTVNGTIMNSAGNSGFVLKSTAAGTASLIHNTDNVPATVQRYITGAAEDWHFLSTPVSDQSISGDWTPTGTYGNGTGYDMYIWNEPTPCWVYHLNTIVAPTWPVTHPSADFVPVQGYLYSVQAANPTKTFVGNLNNGNLTYPLTFASPDLDFKGFNLIGNPYPSSIDWRSPSGWTRTNLEVTGGGNDMWIWNPAAGNYGVINSAGVGAGTNGVTRYIAPMQGFYVRAASNGNIGMTNDLRSHIGANIWFLLPPDTGRVKVQVLSNAGNGFDEVLLQFGYPANEPGAAKIFSPKATAPSLYMTYISSDLTVRYLTNTTENPAVPLNFNPGIDGDYTLNIDFNFDDFDYFILEDKKLDIFQNIKDTATYHFEASVKDAPDRFVLHFAPLGSNSVDELPTRIYYDGREIILDLTSVEDKTQVKIVDVLGRTVLDKMVEGQAIHHLPVDGKNQVYIVYASSKGKSVSRKVFVY